MDDLPRLGQPQARDYIVTDPLGGSQVITNLTRFCKDKGLNRSKMHAVMRGAAKAHKGFRIARISKV